MVKTVDVTVVDKKINTTFNVRIKINSSMLSIIEWLTQHIPCIDIVTMHEVHIY